MVWLILSVEQHSSAAVELMITYDMKLHVSSNCVFTALTKLIYTCCNAIAGFFGFLFERGTIVM